MVDSKIINEWMKKAEEDCEFLNPFYVDTRYPVNWDTSYSEGTAIKAKESTEKIRESVRAKLSIRGV